MDDAHEETPRNDHDSKLELNRKAMASSMDPSNIGASDSNPKTATLPSSHREPTTMEGVMAIVKSSWINPLVIFIPFGIASHFVWSPTVTFILNFVAIVPLAKLLGYATEDISLRVGEVSRPTTIPIVYTQIPFCCVCIGPWGSPECFLW
jgi:Ca2+:H+ antiporter